jgi:hypothetical protein
LAGEGYFGETGRVLEGPHTSLEGYRAPDGGTIRTMTTQFESADAAKAAHQKLDHSAAEIVKQEDILDESGKVIGERSVLTLVDKDHKKSTAIIITKGVDFREFVSSSAQDVLAFEEDCLKGRVHPSPCRR